MKTLENVKKLTMNQMRQITGGDDVSFPFRNKIIILPPPPPPPNWPENEMRIKDINSKPML